MPVGAEAETRTVIVKDVDAPTVRLPTEQVSVVVPEHGIDEDTYEVFESSTSVTTMPLAVAGPLFVTLIVYVS